MVVPPLWDMKMVKNKEPKYTKQQLREMFHHNIVNVDFEKIDGTERKLRATLMPQYLPPKDIGKLLVEQGNRAENNDVLSVWSLDDNGWRSFRVKNVFEITIESLDNTTEM